MSGKQQGSEPQSTRSVPDHYVSRRSWTFWEKVRSWYPNKLAEKCPEDYCKLIDACNDREKLAAVLSNMRQRHATWPPTFPEFALLFTEQAPERQSVDWPVKIAQLENYARKKYPHLTFEQWRRVGTVGVGDPRGAFRFTGISFPADGERAALVVKFDEAGI